MSKKFEVVTPSTFTKDGQEQTYWTKIGTAYENDKGNIVINLVALPVNGKMILREPAPKKQFYGKNNYSQNRAPQQPKAQQQQSFDNNGYDDNGYN